VTCILAHRDGHREETSLDLMHDSTGSKNSVQAIGSSVSYGKRYTMCALLNITTKNEDDDGATADTSGWISDAQSRELDALIRETSSDLAKYLKHMGVDALYKIPAAQFTEAKQALLAKRSSQK
jgi:hypothetical protein